jgi:uncharacterized protein (TIGR03435 family)
MLTLWVAVLPSLLLAQIPIPVDPRTDPALRFEVASVKAFEGDGPTRFRMQASARLDVTAAPARILLVNAFQVQDDHLIGLPDWANNERYSVLATAPAGAKVSAIPTMLTNLLVDRFELVWHREKRETQSFDLVRVGNDAPLGPALKPTPAACAATIAGQSPAPPAAPPAGPDQVPCGSLQTGAGLARAAGVPLFRLARMLSQLTGRPVNDRTGLSDLYDFTLKFDPNVNTPSVGPTDASHLFTALPEQLGLRLQSQRALVDAVVIDRIERPTLD